MLLLKLFLFVSSVAIALAAEVDNKGEEELKTNLENFENTTTDGQENEMGFGEEGDEDELEDGALGIVGGRFVRAGTFPHVVSVQKRKGGGFAHTCGGSILRNDTVITAAHCCRGLRASGLRVVAGIVDQTNYGPLSQTSLVSRVQIVPGFNPSTLAFDGCKLTLSTPLTYNRVINEVPICWRTPTTGQNCFTTGWGATNTAGTSFQPRLKTVAEQIVSKNVCNRAYGTRFGRSVICAGGVRNRGVCTGDSGGPLTCRFGSRRCVAGLTSFSSDLCAQQGIPSGYFNVRSSAQFLRA